MTRVPKFRAWDKNEKKMLTNSQLIIWNGNVYANDGKRLSADHLRGWSIDEKYLMQSTGLKDKNGAEIYESDIVFACDYDDEQGADVYEVCYLEESLEWVLRRIVKEKEFHLSILDWDELEVIGNVYEYKELLG